MSQDAGNWDEAVDCVDCGAVLWPDVDRTFACSADTYLCFECAERRGGVYDEEADGWSVPPDMSGLPDERRPHA
jgi:hypothetical protein